MKIHLFYIGKARDRQLNAAAEEYVKRTGRYARCEMREIKPQREDWKARYPSAVKVLLDPAGKTMDSARFIELVAKCEREARDLVFVVGGSDGLPKGWSTGADLLLSLSPMTLPHELARVVLAEQIYRAFTTLRGHPYPR